MEANRGGGFHVGKFFDSPKGVKRLEFFAMDLNMALPVHRKLLGETDCQIQASNSIINSGLLQSYEQTFIACAFLIQKRVLAANPKTYR